MAFEKEIVYEVQSYETYEAKSEEELRKVASARIDLPEDFVYDPDYLYMWIRIISSGEYYGPNKNGDYFPNEELEGSYHTFGEANVFKNHENKKIEKAIGKIFAVRWNPLMKTTELFKGIDKKIAPEIARGYLKGYMTDVSMGCKVPYTICSVCGNKARRASEFCTHVKNHRMAFLGNGERVFEINYEPKFHDSSVVLNGAERVAKALFIMDENPNATIDGGTIIRSFRKAANEKQILCDTELEKVANHMENVHPLLQEYKQEKVASSNSMMQKLAELEKEVTGKLLNIVSSPAECKADAVKPMINIIKFLTEKRLEEETITQIAKNLSSISTINNIPLSKVFSGFLAVTEMMGIELFPTELHTLLTELTSAKLEDCLCLSETDEEVAYPSQYADGIKFTKRLITNLPEFDDPHELFKTYDEVPFELNTFNENPARLFEMVKGSGHDLDDELPISIIRLMKSTLEPFMPIRSHHPEFLLPRLSLVLGNHRSLLGDADVAKDIQILRAPQSAGDVLASLVYGNYQKMRPQIIVSKMLKTAEQYESSLIKTAEFNGIKRRHLLVTAVPAAYAASAFEKNRREDGKVLSDVESFIANRPDVIAGGVLLGGKPLTRLIANKVSQGKELTIKGVDRVKNGFDKLTSEEYVGLIKVADDLGSGNFNAFNKEFMSKFAEEYNVPAEYVGALKVASLLDVGGYEKEASAIAQKFEIGEYEKATFLKAASEYSKKEIEKAASEFANIMIMDTVFDAKKALNTSLPGRVIDSLVFSGLSKKLEPKNTMTNGGEL